MGKRLWCCSCIRSTRDDLPLSYQLVSQSPTASSLTNKISMFSTYSVSLKPNMELDVQTGLHFQEMSISRWLTQRQLMTNQSVDSLYFTKPNPTDSFCKLVLVQIINSIYGIWSPTIPWFAKDSQTLHNANEYKQQSSVVPVNNTPKFQWNIVYSSFQMWSVLYTIHLPEPSKTRVHQMWPSKHTLPINSGHTLATH